MTYTQRYSEEWELIDTIYGVAVAAAAVNDSGLNLLANYIRTVIVIHPLSLNDALDIDIEQATTAAGALSTFAAGAKDITVAAADTAPSVIEIRNEEFSAGYEYLNIEVTAANTGGGANYFVVEFWGLPVYKPADTTNLDSVTD
jgi:hypothetical protein